MAAEAGQSFVVLSELGENQCVVFGRNSLQGGEAEAVKVPEVVFVPAGETTKCPNAEVEAVAASLAVILNRTIKSWGADSGANEKGVTISVSWATNERGLLATDLARLGLERSATAAEAVEVIAQLNEKHGMEYENEDSPKLSLLICDSSEAWVLDIAGKLWAAEKVEGFRKLPPSLGVGTKIDKSSENVSARAHDLSVWDGSGEFSFRGAFGGAKPEDFQWPGGDLAAGSVFSLEDMFGVLRGQEEAGGVKSSQVSVLSRDKMSCHWFTATNNTKESVFKPFVFTENVRISPLTVLDKDADVTLLAKYHAGRDWEKAGELLKSLEETCVAEVKEALGSGPDPTELEELMKDCVEAEVKFYR